MIRSLRPPEGRSSATPDRGAAEEAAPSVPVLLLSRRAFCRLVGTGCAAFALPGCGDTSTGGTMMPNPDLGVVHDLAKLCPNGGATAVGAATSLQVNQVVHLASDNLFVVRDSKGLYALTDICTHEGTIITFVSSSKSFHCFSHGSNFDLNGNVKTGPAASPLDHYAACAESNGDVVVDPNTTVDPSTRI